MWTTRACCRRSTCPSTWCSASATRRARVAPAYDEIWPVVRCLPEAVQIRFVAGYGAAAAVPEDIKEAMLLIIGHLYAHREENHDFELYEMPLGALRPLSPYRITRFD